MTIQEYAELQLLEIQLEARINELQIAMSFTTGDHYWGRTAMLKQELEEVQHQLANSSIEPEYIFETLPKISEKEYYLVAK